MLEGKKILSLLSQALGEQVKGWHKKDARGWRRLSLLHNSEENGLCFRITSPDTLLLYDHRAKAKKRSHIIKDSVFKPLYSEHEEKVFDPQAYFDLQDHYISPYFKGLPFKKQNKWKVGEDGRVWVPYFDFNFLINGVQIYQHNPGGKTKFYSLKGSNKKGCFHPHRYNKSNKTWVLGEGFKECLLAAHLFKEYNVLECGGVSNIKEVMSLIPIEDRVYLLGEKGSEKEYESYKLSRKNTILNFPKLGKDFADDYLADRNESRVKDSILSEDVREDHVRFKILGYDASDNVCVYSKISGEVHQTKTDKSLLRKCFPGSVNDIKQKVKNELLDRFHEEALMRGLYQKEFEYGIGLWKDDETGLIIGSTGEKLYKVGKESLTPIDKSELLRNDFLLVRCDTRLKELPSKDLTREDMDLIEKAILNCHWSKSTFGKVLLGFCVQSYYAGCIEWRPHLWLKSDSNTAGKTTILTWLDSNIMYLNRFLSGYSTSEAGIRSEMGIHSIPVLIDEFGEDDSGLSKTSEFETKKTILALRNACCSDARIVKGSPEQKSISQRLRFSAILACIEPSPKLLAEQDHARIIFISLSKKDANKLDYMKNVKPLLDKLTKERRTRGFISYCWKKFYLYEGWKNKYETRLVGLGFDTHKYKSIASVCAGWAIFKNSEEEGWALLKEIEEECPELLARPTVKEDDLVLDLITFNVVSSFGIKKPLGLCVDDIEQIAGVKLEDNFVLAISVEKLYSYLKASNFFSYGGFSKVHFRNMLVNSKYYMKPPNGNYWEKRIGGKRLRAIKLDLKELEPYLCNS